MTARIIYTTIASPIGDLLLASSKRGLVKVGLAGEDRDDALELLAAWSGGKVENDAGRLDSVTHQFQQYFGGQRRDFDINLDFSLSTGFYRSVQELLPTIGYGTTISYTELAGRAGNPGAVRATGSACAANPLPIVAPCHRVLRRDGSLGGYTGGLAIKELLLKLEGQAPISPRA